LEKAFPLPGLKLYFSSADADVPGLPTVGQPLFRDVATNRRRRIAADGKAVKVVDKTDRQISSTKLGDSKTIPKKFTKTVLQNLLATLLTRSKIQYTNDF
jgi:hypothetical protein